MKKDFTQLVFILDMSGSMSSLTADTIGGFNTLIREQKEAKGNAIVTTVLFNDEYRMIHDGVDINEVAEMTYKDYRPISTTALLDAVGNTINHVGGKLAEMNEDERPDKVMVTIVTDGYENASKEFSQPKVKEMIEHQRSKYNWIFSFIGANMDAVHVAQKYGVDPRFSRTYTATSAGTRSVYTAMSAMYSQTRDTSAEELRNVATLDSLSSNLDEVR